MRRIITLLALFLITCSQMKGQDRDSVLASMNAVKLATDRYLYGVSTQTDADRARIEAANELSKNAMSWIGEMGYTGVKSLDNLPEDAFAYLDCQLMDGVYRSLVYVEKDYITGYDQEITASSSTRIDDSKVSALLSLMAEAVTIGDLVEIMMKSDCADTVRYGMLDHNTLQECIDKGYIAFYDSKTKSLIDLISPIDISGHRTSLKSGVEANLLALGREPAIWIIFAQ